MREVFGSENPRLSLCMQYPWVLLSDFTPSHVYSEEEEEEEAVAGET